MKSVSRRLAYGAVLCAAVLAFGSAGAAEVDPAAVAYKKLGDIPGSRILSFPAPIP